MLTALAVIGCSSQAAKDNPAPGAKGGGASQNNSEVLIGLWRGEEKQKKVFDKIENSTIVEMEFRKDGTYTRRAYGIFAGKPTTPFEIKGRYRYDGTTISASMSMKENAPYAVRWQPKISNGEMTDDGWTSKKKLILKRISD